jgi:hypothetical protein
MAEFGSPMTIVPLAGTVVALLCLWAAYRTGRRVRLMENIPTSTTQGVFIGLVELKGTAESTHPLVSHLAAQPCVYYAWTVDEHWSRTVTETYRDAKGNRRTRTRRESGWKTVASGGELAPFYLKDADGEVLIQPEGATIETLEVFHETCGPDAPLYYAKGPPDAVSHSDHRRRFIEQALPLHRPIYVMGQARERTDVVAAEIAHDPLAPMFLISVRTEEQIRSGHRFAYWGWTVFGLLLCLVAWGFYLRAASGADALPVGGLLLGGAGYLAAAAGGWLWLAYNSLVDLRQRVHRAWSQVEVQLKRRHDLIPSLVEVVRSSKAHEAETQTALAGLRAQLSATPPGRDGPDYEGLTAPLRALIERYPELQAQEGFDALQRNLADTENRIALARGYFNEIATHFNTRLETVPERFVARLAGMQPQVLMAAARFERAALEINLATGQPACTPRVGAPVCNRLTR